MSEAADDDQDLTELADTRGTIIVVGFTAMLVSLARGR